MLLVYGRMLGLDKSTAQLFIHTTSDIKEPMQPERRKDPRYQQIGLELTVARRGIVGFLRLTPTVDCLDYSRSGLQFGSNQAFKIDEKLVIDLRVLEYEVTEINAVVIECEQVEPGLYCTRVKFCFLERRMQKPKILHALLGIEEKLRVAKQYPS